MRRLTGHGGESSTSDTGERAGGDELWVRLGKTACEGTEEEDDRGEEGGRLAAWDVQKVVSTRFEKTRPGAPHRRCRRIGRRAVGTRSGSSGTAIRTSTVVSYAVPVHPDSWRTEVPTANVRSRSQRALGDLARLSGKDVRHAIELETWNSDPMTERVVATARTNVSQKPT